MIKYLMGIIRVKWYNNNEHKDVVTSIHFVRIETKK